ncbi:FAD:protein FMN transferase, partial [Myxococcota bacterium]|nr:FAD:protein FMN transferase [Myxococcota bacterium]
MSGARGPADSPLCGAGTPRRALRRSRRVGGVGFLVVGLGLGLGLGIALVGMGCAKSAGPATRKDARVTLSDGWLAMGTFFEADLRVRESELSVARTWLDWARVELPRLEAVYSRHDAASQLSSLNRALAASEVVGSGAAVGPALESVLAQSVDLWEATGGAFDVTVGPLVEVWRRAAARDAWPS